LSHAALQCDDQGRENHMSMDEAWIYKLLAGAVLVFAFLLCLVVLAALVGGLARRLVWRKVRSVTGGRFQQGGVEVEREGFRCRIDYIDHTRDAQSCLRLAAGFPFSSDFRIAEDSKTGSGKDGRKLSEVETGDSSFDDRFFIYADSLQFTKLYLAQDEVRTAVAQLFNLGCNEIRSHGNKLFLMWKGFDFRRKSDFIVEAVSAFQLLVTKNPSATETAGVPEPEATEQPERKEHSLPLIVAGSMAFLGLLLSFPILWPPEAKSQLTGKDPEAGKD